MRSKGLEPPRLSAPDPKSGVATNYTTAAKFGTKLRFSIVERKNQNKKINYSQVFRIASFLAMTSTRIVIARNEAIHYKAYFQLS